MLAEPRASPPDKIFYKNFIQDFIEQLKLENRQLDFLRTFLLNMKYENVKVKLYACILERDKFP